MPRELTPTEVGRMFALHRAAEAVSAIAAAHERAMSHDGLDDDGRAYLAAVVSTAHSIAARLRSSPGAEP